MSMLSPHGTTRPEVDDAALVIPPATQANPAVAQRIAIRILVTWLVHGCRAAGSLSAVAAAPGAELRQPGERPDADPDRRQQHVEEDEREAENAPPDGPAPPRNGRLRLHVTSTAASALRPSTVRRMRCAVSSIDSSE